MKATDLAGIRLRIVVHTTPCVVRAAGYEPQTIVGRIERIIDMPGGPIAFDAGLDIKVGKIALELVEDA